MGLPMTPFEAIANPVRRDLLRRLASGPRSVSELAEAFPISRPAISRHLRVLGEGGLVESRAEGTRNLYRVRPEGLEQLRSYFDELWSAALPRFKAVAEALEEA